MFLKCEDYSIEIGEPKFQYVCTLNKTKEYRTSETWIIIFAIKKNQYYWGLLKQLEQKNLEIIEGIQKIKIPGIPIIKIEERDDNIKISLNPRFEKDCVMEYETRED